MDVKKLIPVLAVIGVFVYGGWKIRSHFQHVLQHGTLTPSSHETPASTPAQPLKKGLGEYLHQPREHYETLAKANPAIPAACGDYFERLEAIDFRDFQKTNFKLQYQAIPSPDPDCVIADASYSLAEKDFMQKCMLQHERRSDVVDDDCARALFLMRASVTRLLLKDKPVSEITDLKQLSDLMFAEFVGKSGESDPPDFARLGQVAERMLELNPNLYAAAKVATFSDLEKGMSEKTPEAWQKAQAALKRAETMNPEDPDLTDTAMAIQTQGFDPARTVDEANRMLQEDPNDDRGYFFLAYGQWKANDRQAAIANLQKAIDLNPSREDYRQIMNEITAPKADGDSFKGALSVTVSDDDFNE